MNGPVRDGVWVDRETEIMRPLRGAAVEISPEMFFTMLDLPSTSQVIDVFIDSWTRNLVLVVQDPQFPEKLEGARFISVTPEYTRDPKRTGSRFVKYASAEQ